VGVPFARGRRESDAGREPVDLAAFMGRILSEGSMAGELARLFTKGISSLCSIKKPCSNKKLKTI